MCTTKTMADRSVLDQISTIHIRISSSCIDISRILCETGVYEIFMVADLGYEKPISDNPSKFQVAWGYWDTTKSYTKLM